MNLVILPQEHLSWWEEHSALSSVSLNLEAMWDHYWFPMSRIRKNLYLEFHSLARTWKQEMSHSSSPMEIAMHPAYQQIIGMGPVVIPLILGDLEIEPHLWFWALKTLTGEDPVEHGQRGDILEMARAWVKWGKEHDYCW